jgi:hypothetical protein
MASNDIYLGIAGIENLLPPGGRVFSKGLIELARKGRTASGRKVKDVKAIKESFSIKWDLINDSDLNMITDLFKTSETLELTIRKLDGTTDKLNIMLEPFNAERILSVNEGWWGDVVLECEEI